MMKIILNGENKNIDAGATLDQLVAELRLDGPLAAQVNGDIISWDKLNETLLNEGDEVELFRMMGGG